MPRTALTVQEVEPNANEAITFAAMDQANGMKFLNDGRTILVAKNGDASAHQLTVVSKGDPVFGRTGNLVKSIPAGGEEIVGFLNPAGWNQVSGVDAGNVQVDVDDDTSMTIAVLRLK
ncbi:MAG: hypothetical protein R3B95_11550 [Nitrospirales bacterium]|nr:hypothetical protein [Nitrospirales bacterium]